MEQKKYLLRYQLQFFAKDGPGGEKTEQPTDKKLQDARKEGQVAKSKELGNGVTLLALFAVVKIFGTYISAGLLNYFRAVYSKITDLTAYHNRNFNIGMMHTMVQQTIFQILILVLPVFLIALLIAFVIDVAQVRWKVTSKPLQPKFSKLNPISGFKRIFSMRSIVELIKSIATIALITFIVYSDLQDKFIYLFYLYDITVFEALGFIADLIINLGFKISAVYMIIGFADLVYQKFKFKKDMMMTKQEIKDEYKNSEGDPQIKAQIRKKMMQSSQRRMMQSIPQADVVITNPTHFAVAIQYDPAASKAPVVLAKGEDFLALKMKEKAKEHSVEIVENKPLARALYYNVDVGGEIPPELYQAVAEVLAFVYRIKNKAYNTAG